MRYLFLTLSFFIYSSAHSGVVAKKYSKLIGNSNYWVEYECSMGPLLELAKKVDSCAGVSSEDIYLSVMMEDIGIGPLQEESKVVEQIVESCIKKVTSEYPFAEKCTASFLYNSGMPFGHGKCPGPNEVTKYYCGQMLEEVERDKLSIH